MKTKRICATFSIVQNLIAEKGISQTPACLLFNTLTENVKISKTNLILQRMVRFMDKTIIYSDGFINKSDCVKHWNAFCERMKR